jgi:biopolymer transport protein ExbD
MASISTKAHGGGRKSLNPSIALVPPFIDLLLCCVMFLLVTAVWNDLGRDAN